MLIVQNDIFGSFYEIPDFLKKRTELEMKTLLQINTQWKLRFKSLTVAPSTTFVE